MDHLQLDRPWNAARPHILVVACSDGRLQEATDDFLARALGVREYDRFYPPGGAGALSASGREFVRAQALRRECRFLVEAHGVEHLVLLLHGPARDGPPIAVCADYKRKHPWATPAQIRAQQETDVRDLLGRRPEFAGAARVSVYRFEVNADHTVSVETLHADAGTLADAMPDEDRPAQPEPPAQAAMLPFLGLAGLHIPRTPERPSEE